MAAVSLSPVFKWQFNQGGIPLAGGLLFTYQSGTTIKQATYTTSAGNVANTNPIVLDANGQCDLWLVNGQNYTLVLAPSTDTDPPTNSYWTENGVASVPTSQTFTSLTTGTINNVTITAPANDATLTIANHKTLAVSNTLTFTGTDGSTIACGAGGTVAYQGGTLGQFAATTSAQLAGVLSDETGTGVAVFNTDPTFVLTDTTTNNVSTTQHGWCPKAPNDATKALLGTGVFGPIPNNFILLAQVAPSAAVNVDFLSTFSSTYDNYLIELVNIAPATNAVLQARLAIAGAASSLSSYSSTAPGATTTGFVDHANVSVSALNGGAGVGGLSSVIHVLNVNGAASKHMVSNAVFDNTATDNEFRVLGTRFNTALAVTGIRFYWDTGANFMAQGHVRVYGYSNT